MSRRIACSDVNEAKTLEAEAGDFGLEAGLEAEAGFEAGLSHKSKKKFVTHIKI